MFVTSACKVVVPGTPYLPFPSPYHSQHPGHLLFGHSVNRCDLDRRFNPDLDLSVSTLHMDMHPAFFKGEEMDSKWTFTEYGGAHPLILGTPTDTAVRPTRGLSLLRG
jgi:hypothetical protein